MNILKSIRKTYFATLMTLLVLFTSYGQNGSSISLNKQEILTKSRNHDKTIRLLTDTEITQIGKQHNTNLELLMSKNPKNLNDVKTRALEL